jgi:hypothetical protein
MASLGFFPPMLARLVRTPPESPEWEYELKLDGYRDVLSPKFVKNCGLTPRVPPDTA